MELFLADPRTTQKSLGLSQELMKALLQMIFGIHY
jgi:hypothetical protein